MKFFTNTPDIETMVHDLSQFSIKDLAKYCGIAPDTMSRYAKSNQAPQSVRMALFWISSFGREYLMIDAQNETRLYASMVKTLQLQNQSLLSAIETLEQELKSALPRHGFRPYPANEHFLDPTQVTRHVVVGRFRKP